MEKSNSNLPEDCTAYKEMVWAYSLRQIKIKCGYQVNVASKVVDLFELKKRTTGPTEKKRRRISNCLSMLPEDCAEKILAFTSPLDVCRFSLVSKSVQSTAESDSVWANFLPSNYQSIISASLTPVPDFLSKKDLYVYLCRNPLLIDAGLKLFSLEKWTGKICYFLGARDLKIAWSDAPQYWKWISLPESRFPEVAKLKHVVLLDIQVKVRACVLSPLTSYAAYLVYKFEGESSFLSELLHVQSYIQRPKLRDDGWFEVELGVFYTESEVGYIEIHVKEAEGVAYQEESLIVEGIEIRPRMG